MCKVSLDVFKMELYLEIKVSFLYFCQLVAIYFNLSEK